MNQQDLRVAVWMDAIQIAEQAAQEFGELKGTPAMVAARRMRARMVQELEECEPAQPAPV